MQREIEIRFKISNEERESIFSVLQDANWNPTTQEETDVYFCNSELVEAGKSQDSPYVIRIRKSKKGNTLAYKSFSGEGSWVEIESGIEDPDSVRKILEYLGQAAYLKIEKKRQRGRVGDIEINIDEIKNLGLFVELEIVEGDEERGKKELIKFAKEKLGIPEVNIVHKGYVQLMEQFLAESKKTEDH